MIANLKRVLPLLLVLVVASLGTQLGSALLGVNLPSVNEEAEGARILAHRKALQDGAYPKHRDILLAGSSRTMAGFSAARVAETLGGDRNTWTAYNLGNVGNQLATFEKNLTGARVPRLLILELSPHLLTLAPVTAHQKGVYDRYRQGVEVFELRLSGAVRGALCVVGIPRLGWDTIRGWSRFPRLPKASWEDLLLYTLVSGGSAQKLMPDGQVFYHANLPDREAARRVQPFRGDRVRYYRERAGQSRVNETAWAAFERLISRSPREYRLVVVRPPLDPRLYALENNWGSEIIARVTKLLEKTKTPFIDLNPHPFFLSDLSHLDHYDTGAASELLAERILASGVTVSSQENCVAAYPHPPPFR